MAYRTGNWINAKFAGHCSTCSARIIRGDTVRYYPMRRAVDCKPCGEKREAKTAPAPGFIDIDRLQEDAWSDMVGR